MDGKFVSSRFGVSAVAAALVVFTSLPIHAQSTAVAVDSKTMPCVATVDRHFMSYNIEMAEVSRGNFWP